jgi:hypothetical protein
MAQEILGWLMCAIGGIFFVFKLYVAYSCSRSIQTGGVPTLDGVFIPPVIIALGLGVVGTGNPSVKWPLFVYFLIWLVATLIGFAAHALIAWSGKRSRR